MDSYYRYSWVTCFFYLRLVFKDSCMLMLVVIFYSFSPFFSILLYKYLTVTHYGLSNGCLFFLVFFTIMNKSINTLEHIFWCPRVSQCKSRIERLKNYTVQLYQVMPSFSKYS